MVFVSNTGSYRSSVFGMATLKRRLVKRVTSILLVETGWLNEPINRAPDGTAEGSFNLTSVLIPYPLSLSAFRYPPSVPFRVPCSACPVHARSESC